MSKEEFNQRIEELSKLYEDGKDELICLPVSYADSGLAKLFTILEQMRTIAATALQQAAQA